ncbi:hypothetical protein [Bacillus sp. RC252]
MLVALCVGLNQKIANTIKRENKDIAIFLKRKAEIEEFEEL